MMLSTRERLEAAIEEAILALDVLDGDADLEAGCDDDGSDGDDDEADNCELPHPPRWIEDRQRA